MTGYFSKNSLNIECSLPSINELLSQLHYPPSRDPRTSVSLRFLPRSRQLPSKKNLAAGLPVYLSRLRRQLPSCSFYCVRRPRPFPSRNRVFPIGSLLPSSRSGHLPYLSCSSLFLIFPRLSSLFSSFRSHLPYLSPVLPSLSFLSAYREIVTRSLSSSLSLFTISLFPPLSPCPPCPPSLFPRPSGPTSSRGCLFHCLVGAYVGGCD